ncbi:MAG: B12-binding domain-containing radical SAM protein [Candidatus Coatesbacteria bacterium]|nr:B12-binding domain-containing radical SAM protein [Candidatus Coatesbacteria bacterium]
MQFTLVYPRFDYQGGILDEEPLGILYVASSLRDAGHAVSLIDLTFETRLERFAGECVEADVIALGFTSPLFGRAKRVLKFVKSAAKNATIVAGGVHATILPEEVLRAGFDYAFIGEGERSIVEFAERLSSGAARDTPGIACLENGNLSQSLPAPFIENLDSLPFPARDLIDYGRYERRAGLNQVGMIATRGCPFKCSFCKPTLDKLFGKLRKRSAENVASEIEEVIGRFGPGVGIFFKDDTMSLLGLSWFEELEGILTSRRLSPKWHCSARVDTVNPKLLAAMKRCGCRVISFGVEAGSQRILDFYRKDITPSQVEDAFRWCRKVGIQATANVILGAPDETRDELQATFDLMRRIKPADIYVYFCSALPETDMYWAIAEAGCLAEMSDPEEFDNVKSKARGGTNVKLKNLTFDVLKEYERRIERLNLSHKLRSPRRLASWAMKAVRQPSLLGPRIRSVLHKARS